MSDRLTQNPFDRSFGWAGDNDAPWRVAKVRAFEIILVMHICVEHFLRGLQTPSPWPVAPGLEVFGSLLAGLFVFATPWRRTAFGVLAALQLLFVVRTFPHPGNHTFLLFFLVSLRAFLDCGKEEEAELFLRTGRWMLALVFFWGGVQKFVHGFYFRGEIFAYYISEKEHFRSMLGFLLPGDELARLLTYSNVEGDGPYRSASLPLTLLSNVVWLAEMALPVFLIVRRTRRAALIVTFVHLFFIEVGAREFFFGAVFTNMLLLYAPKDHHRKFVPIFALFYVWMVLVRLDILPEFKFL